MFDKIRNIYGDYQHNYNDNYGTDVHTKVLLDCIYIYDGNEKLYKYIIRSLSHDVYVPRSQIKHYLDDCHIQKI